MLFTNRSQKDLQLLAFLAYYQNIRFIKKPHGRIFILEYDIFIAVKNNATFSGQNISEFNIQLSTFKNERDNVSYER